VTKEYAVVYEWAGGNYSAYVPDLPGCVTTGQTMEDAKRNMREAIEGHIAVMREYSEPIPEPTTLTEALAVAV
jgi:predicted RNase H-like HicB family nuclease